MNPHTPRMVVTDCCGQLLPESQTLVGDVHFSDLCPACTWLDGREHERHVTCDWSQGVECPGRDWSYGHGPVLRPAKALREQARERGIKRDGTWFGVVTGKRIAADETSDIPPAEKGQADA